MTITSTRDERLHVPPPVGHTDVAGFFAGRPAREGASRWIAALYFVIALATPFLLYAGPEVLSPAVARDCRSRGRRHVRDLAPHVAHQLTAPAAQFARAFVSSDQHALDAAAIGLRDVIRHPLLAQDVPCKLDDDVVGLRAGIVGEARQPLQARRA